MKRNVFELVEGVVYREVDGNLLILDQQNKRYHCLNETAMSVFLLCDGKHSEGDICSEVGSRYVDDENNIDCDIRNTIKTLIQLELIRATEEID